MDAFYSSVCNLHSVIHSFLLLNSTKHLPILFQVLTIQGWLNPSPTLYASQPSGGWITRNKTVQIYLSSEGTNMIQSITITLPCLSPSYQITRSVLLFCSFASCQPVPTYRHLDRKPVHQVHCCAPSTQYGLGHRHTLIKGCICGRK